MKKVKFKIVSGDATLQSYCPETGASWTFIRDDGVLLNYLEAHKIRDNLVEGPFGDAMDIIMIDMKKAAEAKVTKKWGNCKGLKETADSNGLRLALIARARALDKYEDKWDLLSKEVQNALVLSEVALIIADQDHDERFEWASAAVQRSLIDLGY
jgi:hypothetical protein